MARFEIGDCVRLLYDVASDGTVYGVKRGDPLISAGEAGYVKRRGTFLRDEVVYDVHFIDRDRIVGCREKELTAYDEPWLPASHMKGDHVKAALDLSHRGTTLVDSGTPGVIYAIRYHRERGYVYETRFKGTKDLCLVMEDQIEEVCKHSGVNDIFVEEDVP